MRVKVDKESNSIYVNLTDRTIKNSAEVADGIIVDYDDESRVVGVEVLDASKRTGDPIVVSQFKFDLPREVCLLRSPYRCAHASYESLNTDEKYPERQV